MADFKKWLRSFIFRLLMSKNYTHLSLEQRYQIEALLNQGLNQKSIAQYLEVSTSTISRELRRNTNKRGLGSHVYKAANAQEKTLIRHQSKPKHIRFTESMKKYIAESMRGEKWSPEIISVEGKKKYGDFVSLETIYKWIWFCKKSRRREIQDYINLFLDLKHGRRRRKRGAYHENRGCIVNRTSITERPKIVDRRKRVGDLEIDIMLGKKDKYGVLTIVDRASLKSWIRKINSRDAYTIKKRIIDTLRNNKWIKTITFDNEKCFSRHQEIDQSLSSKSFFARPYTSQDKGTVENKIGIIRRFLPKGRDFKNLTPQELKIIENKINRRPVRKFNYKTPNQVFSEKIALIG